MVNVKNVAFKVNKQTPISQTPPQAYGTVINCRKPGGKRAFKELKEVRSHSVPLTNVSGTKKRKRDGRKSEEFQNHADFLTSAPANAQAALAAMREATQPLITQKLKQVKPTRFRKGKVLEKGFDLDTWWTILTFSDPAQLLEMRQKIPSCYRFLRNNPMLWVHSRTNLYGDDMPEPPSDLDEFQYAHLRHGHGCMSCGAPSTRKTYWAFLRRWCKTCLQSKTVKEHDALISMRDVGIEDVTFLRKCLPSGVFDSWGNFVGVGPASTHSLKTIYLLSEVNKLQCEVRAAAELYPDTWSAELRPRMAQKFAMVDERRAFARKMELWEEATRNSKASDYQAKKAARKVYFEDRASKLDPPIGLKEMEACPSYRRAVAIPKDPNNTSWQQLKPKLEMEAAELRLGRATPETRLGTASASASGTSTPSNMQPYHHPIPAFLAMPPHHPHHPYHAHHQHQHQHHPHSHPHPPPY
ncbi:uncharacterized protein M421DRAFT_100880 [Didymella exigua CBS 183.55]|uniref:F-box domain-containing protein n=1 Tax=Didymella exigua CBS 183.55 TaxID=1150837 RepID=A0A6A5RNF3_9PLEO|nr:uncharacterized protein M421DRAFT_100880 [Didymella exigua CBS 183.55]KAF1928554.1 hypothetical protein M421DRAFT_100880 [Didymella exigua CBS 183.55]